MSDASKQSVPLPAIVDLDASEALREELLGAIDKGPVDIDGAKVERVATNALIMLLSGAETARRCNTKFVISAPSEAMTSAIARLGMQDRFAGILEG